MFHPEGLRLPITLVVGGDLLAFLHDQPCGWEPGAEKATFAGFADDLKSRLMASQHMLDNSEAQPGTPRFPRPPMVNTIESFRKTRDMLRFNAHAAVLYGKCALP